MDPSTTRTARRINSAIRNKIVDMYKQFVSEVDPTDVLDLLIEKRIIPLDRREEVLNHRTKPERCRALLDQLFICSHNEAFIVLRKAINERYPWLVERIDASETEEEDGPTGPTRTTAEVFITTLEVKLKAAEKRIAELEEEVARYKNQNDQLKQLLQRSHEDKLGASVDDVDTAYGPLPDVTGHYIKPTKQGEEVSSDKPTNGCPSLPSSRPCRSKSPMEAKAPAKDNGADATPLPGCLSFLNTITGSAAVRGMAMMDSTLFVVRFGSLLVEMYDGKDKFKRSRKNILISPPDHKDNTGFPRKINIVKRGDKVRASSGIQDIACCHLNKRLYVSDWQGRCVHCVNPAKREIVRCWTVEAGRPWGLSVTREGTVVVSLGDSGELCEYTGEGILLRTVALKTVEEGPWHGVQFGKDAWMFCHGERYGTGGYVSVADLEGNHFGGCRYREIHMQGPSHLALLPDNRVLVAESERNRVVVLDQSLSGPGLEILNPDHGVTMPVRLHYCRSSEKLFVGLHNGSILVYQMKNAVTAPSTSISQC